MRKKLLLAENANLFAETERKQIENETLKIKLSEEKENAHRLEKENEKLMLKISELLCEIREKDEKIRILAKGVENSEILSEQAVEQTAEPAEEVTTCRPKEVKAEAVEKKSEPTLATESKKPEESKEISKEQSKILMEKGAAAISAVTKAVAECYTKCEDLNAEEAERIYSLALGKNESFKIKVAGLLEEKGDIDALLIILEEMKKKSIKQIEELI